MGFLDIDVKGATEPKAVSGDAEYQVRIVSIEQRINKSGNPFLFPRFDIPEEPTSKDFSKYLPLPCDGMTDKQVNNAKWGLKAFFDAFGIDAGKKIDIDDCVGSTAWAILGVSEDEEYGEQNFIKRFIKAK
jgi:hypothetical protein